MMEAWQCPLVVVTKRPGVRVVTVRKDGGRIHQIRVEKDGDSCWLARFDGEVIAEGFTMTETIARAVVNFYLHFEEGEQG